MCSNGPTLTSFKLIFPTLKNLTITIYTTKQPQYLPKISDVSATTVAFFELITPVSYTHLTLPTIYSV